MVSKWQFFRFPRRHGLSWTVVETSEIPRPAVNAIGYPLVMTNIAMENGPFIDDFPIKTSIYKGFSMAMLVITRW